MASFLVDPKLTEFLNDNNLKVTSTYPIKPEIYARHFDFEKRKKFTGFEKIMHLDSKHRAHLLRLYPHSDQVALIPIDELIAHLYPANSLIFSDGAAG